MDRNIKQNLEHLTISISTLSTNNIIILDAASLFKNLNSNK